MPRDNLADPTRTMTSARGMNQCRRHIKEGPIDPYALKISA